MQLPGRAGYAVRPPGPALLQGLLHRGLRRLHLRQRPLPLRGMQAMRLSSVVTTEVGTRSFWQSEATAHGVMGCPSFLPCLLLS
jgi:hypothetical protein